jgi:hypothetical protein
MVDAIFELLDSESLGTIDQVDTASIIIRIHESDKTRRIHVNRIVAVESSRPGQLLIGLVQKVSRIAEIEEGSSIALTTALPLERDTARVILIGTFVPRIGSAQHVFRRSLDVVPEVGSICWSLEGDNLTRFMRTLAKSGSAGLSLGTYSLDDRADAYVDADKLFQRHAAIVGSTGSGKSWTVARLIEQAADLPNANAIVVDVHGEYSSLIGDGISHFRISGPQEIGTEKSLKDGIIHLPFWLLGYEAIISLLVDRSDQNAPNQSMVFTREIRKLREQTVSAETSLLKSVTIDSPIPYYVENLIEKLEQLNTERVNGTSNKGRGGDFNGKLSRAIARLEAKSQDRRLGFMFSAPPEAYQLDWLNKLIMTLMSSRDSQPQQKGGIKIVDFSEVPSDILPLMVSLVASLIFTVQQWQLPEARNPIALICDEAHLYIPEDKTGNADQVSVGVFERIAKEGRKYGTSLIVVSQRPAEVNRTVMSQCGSLLSMRLTNAEDQTVIRKILPDSLGGLSDVLPILDIGEALVVGDASLLPMRIRVTEPKLKPKSQSIDFWTRWGTASKPHDLSSAVAAWRRQSFE